MTITQEILERAFKEIMDMPGHIVCDLDGWDAVTKEPPFLCVVCATATSKHPHKNLHPRCYYCWGEYLANKEWQP